MSEQFNYLNFQDCGRQFVIFNEDFMETRSGICPICSISLSKDVTLGNLHIDACLAKLHTHTRKAEERPPNANVPYLSYKITCIDELPGLFLIQNFISEEEEQLVLSFLDDNSKISWKFSSFNGSCLTKKFGMVTQYGLPDELRLVRPNELDNGEVSLPAELKFLPERLKWIVAQHPTLFPSELRAFEPNECNANSYLRSEQHSLRPHFDDRTLSGPVLMNLSMAGSALMTFAKPSNDKLNTAAIAAGTFTAAWEVPLPRRCLQLVTGAARWSFTHGIRQEHILEDRRVSITWRQAGGKRGLLSAELKKGSDITSQLNARPNSSIVPRKNKESR
jgi:hypothetical protein